jgi:hypothetical protein
MWKNSNSKNGLNQLEIQSLIYNIEENDVITEGRKKAIKRFWEMADNDEAKLILGQPSLGLVQLLVNVVRDDTNDCRGYALGCLWYLSRASENKPYLSSRELNLLPLLINHIRLHDLFSEFCVNILINCCLEPSSHDFLFDETLEFLSLLQQRIRDGTGNVDTFVIFANIASCIESNNLISFIQYQIHEVMVNNLFSRGINVSQWSGRNGGIVYWVLNFLIDFTNHQETLFLFHESQLKDSWFLFHLLECKDIEGIKALCIICNLSNEFELYHDWIRVCLIKFPHLLDLLINCIGCTLDCDKGDYATKANNHGFVFGILLLKTMTNTVRYLCRASIKNCHLFIGHPSCMKLLLRALHLFNEDADELVAKFDCVEYGGGGGKDIDSLHNVIEIFYLLSLSLSESQDLVSGIPDRSSKDEISGKARYIRNFRVRMKDFFTSTSTSMNLEPKSLREKEISELKTVFLAFQQKNQLEEEVKKLLNLPSFRSIPEETRIIGQLLLKQLLLITE